MNPSDYGMLWMGQFAQDRMILDDSSMLSVGMSVMDDITHQTHSMDMNPLLGNVSEYTAVTAPGPIAITPDILYPLSSTQHPQYDNQPQQTLLQYSLVDEDDDVDEDNDNNDEDKDVIKSEDNSNSSKIIMQQQIVQFHQQQQQQLEDEQQMQLNEHQLQQQQQLHLHQQQLQQKIMNDDDLNEHKPNDLEHYQIFDSDTENNYAIGDIVEKDGTNGTRTNKKIKPVKRPGLVLKTPIAYQPCLDPSVIPIQRDGMAVCERCGAIGVKHSFYTKERRFCSMSCARNELESLSRRGIHPKNIINDNQPQQQTMIENIDETVANMTEIDIEQELTANQLQNPNYRFKMTPRHSSDHNGIMYKEILPQEDFPEIIKGHRLPSPCQQEEKIISVRRKPQLFPNSYDWSVQLNDKHFCAAPVTCFTHAPGYDQWTNIAVGIKVEVENTDCDTYGIQQNQTPHSFWVATVLQIYGYKALIRYEGFEQDNSHDFWVNLCSSEVHPVGWCATRGKPLIPPRSIENKFNDWKDFLVKHLSGARTLPSTFYNKINESFKSRFRIGLQLEVVDKNRISQVKLATVQKIVGKRLYVNYYDSPPEDDGFWCHEDSPLIHPVGWSTTVGHNLVAPEDYLERMQAAGIDQMIEVHDDDSGMELFKMNFTFEEYILQGKSSVFQTGMKLEAVDPLNLSSICVATVMAVLKFGYIMIRIDSYEPDESGADWFCYHELSPCIFPPGFCEENDITLTPPRGYENDRFDWNTYLQDTNSIPAETHLFLREMPMHGFKVGMKLECADLMDPRLVCVATISKVVGRLLKVHFDGWEDEYDQWLDCESPDVYPVGWCVLVGHKLEGPRILPKQPAIVKHIPKSARKKRKKKGGKLETGKTTNQTLQMRVNAIKKEKEAFDRQRQTNNSMSSQMDDMVVDDRPDGIMEMDDEYYDDDEDAVSEQSTPTVTPEPRTMTNNGGVGDIKMKSQSNTNVVVVTAVTNTTTSTIQVPSAPPPERKATSYINNSTVSNNKLIPRLTDSPDINSSDLHPDTWNIYDVAQFLRVNDCAAHCDTFSRNKVDGKKLMQLTKDDIITMLSMKVGPSLKIFDLIQKLKCKINPQQSRHMKAKNNKKFL